LQSEDIAAGTKLWLFFSNSTKPTRYQAAHSLSCTTLPPVPPVTKWHCRSG